MKIGYLGPKGTFSYEACLEYALNEEKIEFNTIKDVILALDEGKIEEAIVPIENSIQGCVTDSLDTLILKKDIYVKKEILLEIKQNLLVKKGTKLNEIEKIYSHVQALSQCKKYLDEYLPNVQIEKVDSTAKAALIVSQEDKKVACICNKACSKEYNLEILANSIQDNDFNTTKFWVLTKSNFENKDAKKMSMIFSVKDKPGALLEVLEIFNKYNLNLTKIESRPAKTILGEYYFLIDVEIENNNENQALEELNDKKIYIRILGKY